VTFRFFKDSDEKAYDKARRRLGKIRSMEVLSWAETSLWAVQEGLEHYRGRTDRAALEQARTATVGLLAAIDTLLDTHP
jgi:glutathione S-transferase